MTMTIDHPLVRASVSCPICRLPKDIDLVACWPCYRMTDRLSTHGAQAQIEAAEIRLQEPRPWRG